jgi:hypothetical protein
LHADSDPGLPCPACGHLPRHPQPEAARRPTWHHPVRGWFLDRQYPVILDNYYATWNAYGQHYWPAWYLIDTDGFIRYEHFGEGAYSETEQKIRELLEEKQDTLK